VAPGLAISAAAVAMLALMSFMADRHLRHHARIPMQWNFRGRPTWTAPRAIGLAFTPVLAAIVLALGVARNEDGPILLLVAAAFVAVHVIHLWLAARSLSDS